MSDSVLRSIQLLMVEDDQDFREIVLRRLARRGLRVTGVMDYRSAIEALALQVFDVVLLDGSIAGLNCEGPLEDLKRAYPLLPVVVLSGYADRESVGKVLEHGAYKYLIKPCSLDQIEATVVEAVAASARAAHEHEIVHPLTVRTIPPEQNEPVSSGFSGVVLSKAPIRLWQTMFP